MFKTIWIELCFALNFDQTQETQRIQTKLWTHLEFSCSFQLLKNKEDRKSNLFSTQLRPPPRKSFNYWIFQCLRLWIKLCLIRFSQSEFRTSGLLLYLKSVLKDYHLQLMQEKHSRVEASYCVNKTSEDRKTPILTGH